MLEENSFFFFQVSDLIETLVPGWSSNGRPTVLLALRQEKGSWVYVPDHLSVGSSSSNYVPFDLFLKSSAQELLCSVRTFHSHRGGLKVAEQRLNTFVVTLFLDLSCLRF